MVFTYDEALLHQNEGAVNEKLEQIFATILRDLNLDGETPYFQPALNLKVAQTDNHELIELEKNCC